MRSFALALIIPLVTLAGACGTHQRAGDPPGRIAHVVFVKLSNPGDAPALLSEGRQSLATIPGVRSYAQGPPLDAGRPMIDGDYDAAVIMWFDSLDDYRVYVDHPRHKDFVSAWGPRIKWMRIHDVNTGSTVDAR